MTVTTKKRSEHEVSSNASAFYDHYWIGEGAVSRRTDALTDWVLETYLPGMQGKRILEVGVGGEGGLIRKLVANNEVRALDVSLSAVHSCERMGLQVALCDLSSEAAPYPDNYFDCVIALEVFEHFANPQRVLEEIRRMLVDGGQLLISVPTPWSYHWPRLFYPSLFATSEAVMEFLISNRFEVVVHGDGVVQCNMVRCIPDQFKVWNRYYLSRKIPEGDAEGFLAAGLYFWNRANESGVRLSPIEAIDFFRTSYRLSKDERSLLLFARSLLYRVINNEFSEFADIFSAVQRRNDEIATESKESWDDGVALLLLEAELLGVQLSNRMNQIREYARSRPKVVEECRMLGIKLDGT